MTRAQSGNKRLTVVLGVLLAGATAAILILCWREWTNRALLGERERALATMAASLEQADLRLEEQASDMAEMEATLSDLGIENQSMADRMSNLEAQRDHLKADNERKRQRAESLEERVTSLTDELAQARHKVLQLESLPDMLRGDLESARSRLTTLESTIDDQAEALSGVPEVYRFAGISSDKRVFALEGKQLPEGTLPLAIYLHNPAGIILDGWIHRFQDGQLLGHAGKWHQAASALVKGEKVFILPRESHEQHN